MWDSELTNFWMDPNNRSFLVSELITRLGPYAFIMDYLHMYRYEITIIIILSYIISFFIIRRRRKLQKMKKSIFTGEKVIYDANAILSKESLPESEKKREKKAKNGPALIDTTGAKDDESMIPSKEEEDDLDAETMQRMLGSR